MDRPTSICGATVLSSLDRPAAWRLRSVCSSPAQIVLLGSLNRPDWACGSTTEIVLDRFAAWPSVLAWIGLRLGDLDRSGLFDLRLGFTEIHLGQLEKCLGTKYDDVPPLVARGPIFQIQRNHLGRLQKLLATKYADVPTPVRRRLLLRIQRTPPGLGWEVFWGLGAPPA